MKQKTAFKDFLKYFPAADLPVTLTEETKGVFETANNPLPPGLIDRFIGPIEEEEEPFVEYVPCLSIRGMQDVHAVVYWKAALMRYEYILTTYNKTGEQLASATIAGVFVEDQTVLRSVATINPDLSIHIIEGEQQADQSFYSPEDSRAFEMELLANGEIVFTLNSTSETASAWGTKSVNH